MASTSVLHFSLLREFWDYRHVTPHLAYSLTWSLIFSMFIVWLSVCTRLRVWGSQGCGSFSQCYILVGFPHFLICRRSLIKSNGMDKWMNPFPEYVACTPWKAWVVLSIKYSCLQQEELTREKCYGWCIPPKIQALVFKFLLFKGGILGG